MLVSEELKEDIDSSRARLLTIAASARERARIGRLNEKKYQEALQEIHRNTEIKNALRDCINHLVQVYKNVEKYAADRKELSLKRLKTAIETAGLIVPDAEIAGVRLLTEDKKAKIVSEDGTDINLQEGSAYRTILGQLIRYTLIKAQPGALQLELLDEAFNTLSDETIATTREYIDVFKNDMLIIGIEQRNLLFQGLEKTTYRVQKKDGCTIVERLADEFNEEADVTDAL